MTHDAEPGQPGEMIDADTSDIVDDVVTDILAVDDQVTVPDSVVEQVQSLDFDGETFMGDVQDWDEPTVEGDPAVV